MTPIEERNAVTIMKLAKDIIRDHSEILSTIAIQGAGICKQMGQVINTTDDTGITMSKTDYIAIMNFMNALVKRNYSGIASWLKETEQTIKDKIRNTRIFMTPHTRNTYRAARNWLAVILMVLFVAWMTGCTTPRNGCKSTWGKVGY